MADEPIPEPTEAQRIRRQVARDAWSDVAKSLFRGEGDPETREAAFRQFLQTADVYADTRDYLNVPDEAGEYRDALIRILSRISKGWGRWISCSAGWYPIICELDADLAELDGAYVLHQVKEKFGGLRYHAYSERYRGRDTPFHDLIKAAVERSQRTCESCGAPGRLCETCCPGEGWRRVQTLCDDCASSGAGDRIGRIYFPVEPSEPSN